MKWGRNVMKIGIVGCGNISDIYLKNLTTVFENTAVYAVCDLDATKANAQAITPSIHHLHRFTSP